MSLEASSKLLVLAPKRPSFPYHIWNNDDNCTANPGDAYKHILLSLLTWLLTHSTLWHPNPCGRLQTQRWPQHQCQTWYSQCQRHWSLTSGTAPSAGRQPGEHSRLGGRLKQPWLHGKTGSTACRQSSISHTTKSRIWFKPDQTCCTLHIKES